MSPDGTTRPWWVWLQFNQVNLNVILNMYKTSVYKELEQNALWRHQMETFSASLALCDGNSRVTGEFPSHRPVTRSFDIFFDLRLNRRLGKPTRLLETPSHSLWRYCNAENNFAQAYRNPEV